MNTLNQEHVRAIIRATKGRFAKVTYTNGKNETKVYTVRTGVKKYLTAPDPSWKPKQDARDLDGPIRIYSVTAGNVGYKSFSPERIGSIKCGGITWSA